MKGTLIVFGLKRGEKGVSAAYYSRFYRKLYGYNNSSHYGRYHSRIPSFLDGITHIKYANGVIVVGRENGKSVIRFLKSSGARVFSWSIDLSDEEAKLLKGNKIRVTD